VLKAGLGIIGWFFVISPWTLLLISIILYLIGITWNEPLIQISLIPLVLGITWVFLLNPITLLSLRRFVVIGPSGVYYRKIRGKGLFSWNDVSKIEVITRDITPTKDFVIIRIFLFSGKRIDFTSKFYQNREFSKKNYWEMLLNLFHIYYKFGKNPNI